MKAMHWVLIVRAWGDGDDSGHRITMLRFYTRGAAQQVADWLTKKTASQYGPADILFLRDEEA